MNASTHTLIVADDHPLFRSALRQTVARSLPGARVVEADSLEALRAVFAQGHSVDLLLLDLRMPGAQGFSSLMEMRAEHPNVPVVVVSAAEEPVIVARARDFGAAGFIPKSAAAESIDAALHAVLDGGTWFPRTTGAAVSPADADLARRLASLTPQQLRVLGQLGAGRLNKQIASDFDVTEATIKAHMTAILRKLGIHRRTQAALLAQRLLRDDAAPLWSDELRAGDGEPDPEN